MANEDKYDIAVVGAGPAGMMAAGAAAESGAKVILLEKIISLAKTSLTGNGRCNITNAESDLRKLVENYGEDGKFLFRAFLFSVPKKLLIFLKDWGLKQNSPDSRGSSMTKPSGKRQQGFSGKRKSGGCFKRAKKYLLKNKVNICLNSRVSRVIRKSNKIEKAHRGRQRNNR